tara:strand:- start:530 stop:826 length:297 start_codon:yes stop_codon:yes gene_type:complete
MSYSSVPLIQGLIKDTEEYLLSNGINVKKEDKDLLETTLRKEFTKSYDLQTNTPTQIVNSFLYKNYQLSSKLTPRSFSEETFMLIMQWGVHKASKIQD